MTTYRLFDGAGGRPGPSGPALTAYAGNFLAGTAWQVTQWAMWLQGYWWWVPAGGDTAAQKFVTQQVVNNLTGSVITAATVTGATMTAAAMNFTALASPVPLSRGVPYVAETGYVAAHGFPETKPVFGGAGAFTGGITNGPLQAYSDLATSGGTNQVPNGWLTQGSFATASADPATMVPNLGSDTSANFWIDLLVSDIAPLGYPGPYQAFPSMPAPLATNSDAALNFTLGMEFSLSQACTVGKIWFYSGPGLTQLPTETAVYLVSSQQIISGTHGTSPSWSGAAGSGWVSTTVAFTLPAGDYKLAVFNGAAVPAAWNKNTALYWSTGAGGGGIVNGPLSVPDDAHATAPGQSSYHQGASIHWPDTHSGPYNYWLDLEVTPIPAVAVPAGGGGTSMLRRSLLWADL